MMRDAVNTAYSGSFKGATKHQVHPTPKSQRSVPRNTGGPAFPGTNVRPLMNPTHVDFNDKKYNATIKQGRSMP